jgi:hypothetical protein
MSARVERCGFTVPVPFPSPPEIPVKRFWSLDVYDNQTRSELQADQQFWYRRARLTNQ